MKNQRKVFAIGSAKTATTSLGMALKDLGFKHKSYDHYLSNEVYVSGDYETIFCEAEKYESFDDGPWNRGEFYKLLDKRFPKSKFILTIRDSSSWVKSHEKHFSSNSEVLRIQSELWINNYDRKTNIDWYQRRIEQVLEYFKDRPGQLLVMNICNGEGWEKLCPFLGLSTPQLPFPSANTTPKIGKITAVKKKMKKFFDRFA